jgi:hypothetical protein
MPQTPYRPARMASPPANLKRAAPADTSEPMADAARAEKAKRLARILAKSKYDTRDDT